MAPAAASTTLPIRLAAGGGRLSLSRARLHGAACKLRACATFRVDGKECTTWACIFG